jgi:hypothetical protein
MKLRSVPFLVLVLVMAMSACSPGGRKGYPYRWVYVSSQLSEDSQVERIREVAKTASEHGLTGILLSCGVDRLDLQSADYVTRLKEVKKIGEQYGLDIVPSIFSVGYGGSLLAHNRNLAEGLPVEDALFVVKGGEAVLTPDPEVAIANGGFEKEKDGRPADFTGSGEPGQVISIDREVFKEGKASLRFENFDKNPPEAGRLDQEIAVKPRHCYRLTCWIRTEGVDPSKPFGSGNLSLLAFGLPDGRQLEWININAPTNGDWFQAQLGFNSLGYDKVRISLSPAEETKGRFWVDGLQIEEVGLLNVLRRPGTPLTVKGEKNGTVYQEGTDYDTIVDPKLSFRFDHDEPPVRVLKGGRIADGERLRVSWYHGTTVYDGQTTVCMSEPQVYEIWREQARLIQQTLAPKRFFLHMDEIRAGGTCKACLDRKLPMAQILGDCITKAQGILREVNPQAEVFIWSDMLDPNHNAGKSRNYYYHVNENYYGSWNFVPKDLVIACWYYEKRKESLAHFSGLGFRTIAGAYYDADDLENPKGWLEDLAKTPGASGIMYTTWLAKYALLADFGDLVSAARPGKAGN